MPKERSNGIELYWELSGETGDPFVCVHGGFIDHNHWQFLTPFLADSFRVLTYDRRGHSLSDRAPGQGGVASNVADLSALLKNLDLAPAHILGHSYGGLVTLRLAAEQPELFRSMLLHEAPVYELNQETLANELAAANLKGITEATAKIASGQIEAGVRMFVDSALGPHAWAELLDDTRELLFANAPAFVDDVNDPEPFSVDLSKLVNFSQPILLTQGEYGPLALKFISDQLAAELPQAQSLTIAGAEHSPHITHPEAYAAMIKSFINDAQ